MRTHFSHQFKLTVVTLLLLFAGASYALIQITRVPKPSLFSYGATDRMVESPGQQNTFANPPSKEATAAFNRASQRAKKLQDEALRLFKAKQFAKAEEVCSQAIWALGTLNGKPVNASAMRLQGEIRLAQGRYREALMSFNQASQFNRSNAQALGKALAYLGLGKMDEARKQYALVEAGYLKLISDENREYFRQSLPGTKDANALKASIIFMRGKEKVSSTWEEALEDYEMAHQLVPRNFLVASSCAHASRRLKRYDQAARYYAITATFGKGDIAKRAKKALNRYWHPPEREAAMREVAKLR